MFIIIKTSFSVSKLVTRRPKMTRQLVGNVNSTPVAEKVVTPGTVHFIATVDSLYGSEACRTLLNFQTSIIKLIRYTLTAKMCKVSAFYAELFRAGWTGCEAIHCVLEGDYGVAVWCGTPLSTGGELCGVLSIFFCEKLSKLRVLYLFNVGFVEFSCAFLLHTVNVHNLALLQLCNNVVHCAISAKLMIAA
jgi:hypothetical protein